MKPCELRVGDLMTSGPLPASVCDVQKLPLVSCVMPTFNRFPHWTHLINEAVEGFLRQTWLNKELIIVNGCPEQRIVFDHPLVRVLNLLDRPTTLGEQRNLGCMAACGELICPWDDDDVSLPERISQAVRMLSEAEYWKPPQVLFRQGQSPVVWQHAIGWRHHASIFRKVAWRRIGGYPPTSGDEDMKFDELLRLNCTVAPEGDLLPSAWQYLYRFGVSPHHISGKMDPGGGHNEHYAEIGREEIVRGTFAIQPQWREDYSRLAMEALGQV